MAACPLRSFIFIDSVRNLDTPTAIGSLLPLPSQKPMISNFRSLTGRVCHYREPEFQTKIAFSTQLPCIATSRNHEEWIV
jgi:hypothetical protein